MCASWDISSGGNVVMIGQKLWWLKFDLAAAAAFNPKQLTNVVHKINSSIVIIMCLDCIA